VRKVSHALLLLKLAPLPRSLPHCGRALPRQILHWKRILLDKPAEGAEKPPPTIWECVTEPEFDRAGLEASFAQLPSKGADAADSASSKPKPAVTKALDPKRSNAVSCVPAWRAHI
jgi:hypothetical protein